MEGTSKPEVSYRNNDNGTSTVTYKPLSIGEYKLHLKYMDKPVPGSPFTIKIKN
jgi:filamin